MPLPNRENIVPKKSTKDIVYSEMLDLIVKGTLKPGEKLNEAELTDYFGVSRTPIREAIQLLKEVKLVQIIPGQSTIVETINLKDMDNCYLVLTNLQVFAIEQAFPNITEEDIEYLNILLDNFNIASRKNSLQDVVKLDNDFHDYLVNLSNNSYLIDIINMLQLHVTRLKYLYFDDEDMRKFSINEHKKILEFISEKNIEKTKDIMYNHWERVRKSSLKIADNKLNSKENKNN
ncbi:GntR family transcriptional regulator [Miniphocaeibacter halophilus]|uniref:GntR family transcriptional regulator n=1 Tax=Miniphocaeibacter halophilus TaxID=2931922 RepID=A0AC61MVP5_9FIRM|nr:GntR family transcriptional regulator [Miniphocaeibacter halophilus]QQK08400.1 GntR family transcriptional regulator [Miniphocaeibacter halophilus]